MIELRQIKFSEVKGKNYDLFIAASGFEVRAAYQAQQYFGNTNRKVVFGFNNETEDKNRQLNDIFFKKTDLNS